MMKLERITEPTPEIPVLEDVVEIRFGRSGQAIAVPLDLTQLAARISADLMPQLRTQLQQHLEVCVNRALDSAMASMQEEIQRVLLEQLGDPDD